MTSDERLKMCHHAARLLRKFGLAASRAEDAANDVVHDAAVYVLDRGEPCEGPRFVGAVHFAASRYAEESKQVVHIRNTAGEPSRRRPNPITRTRRSRVTNFFPNQIFGCAL